MNKSQKFITVEGHLYKITEHEPEGTLVKIRFEIPVDKPKGIDFFMCEGIDPGPWLYWDCEPIEKN